MTGFRRWVLFYEFLNGGAFVNLGSEVTVEFRNASPLISVIVPVFNEGEQLERLIEELGRVFESIESVRFEILFCDDGSTDSSWEQIEVLSAGRDEIAGLSLSRNFGKDQAVFAGLAAARGEAVVVVDADGQHPPDLLPRMIEAWQAGAEVVEAVKTDRPDQSWLVRAAARLFNQTFSTLTGVNLTEATDFRLLSRTVVDELAAMPERAVFFRGLSTWLGYRRHVIEFEPRSRDAGGTRWSLWSLSRFAVRNLVSFTSAPLHVVTAVGVAFALFAVILGVQTLFNWFVGRAVEGFTTVILLLLVQGSVIMIGLGMIGLYVSEIHKEVKRRPRFVVARRTSSLE